MLCGAVQRGLFPAPAISSRLCPLGSTPRVALQASPCSCGLLPCGIGAPLGGLVVAGDDFEFRVAEVLGMARFGWCGIWNEPDWGAACCIQASSQADSTRPGSCLAVRRASSPLRSDRRLRSDEHPQTGIAGDHALSLSMEAMKVSASWMDALRSLISTSMLPSTVVNSLFSDAMACAFRLCFKTKT